MSSKLKTVDSVRVGDFDVEVVVVVVELVDHPECGMASGVAELAEIDPLDEEVLGDPRLAGFQLCVDPCQPLIERPHGGGFVDDGEPQGVLAVPVEERAAVTEAYQVVVEVGDVRRVAVGIEVFGEILGDRVESLLFQLDQVLVFFFHRLGPVAVQWVRRRGLGSMLSFVTGLLPEIIEPRQWRR